MGFCFFTFLVVINPGAIIYCYPRNRREYMISHIFGSLCIVNMGRFRSLAVMTISTNSNSVPPELEQSSGVVQKLAYRLNLRFWDASLEHTSMPHREGNSMGGPSLSNRCICVLGFFGRETAQECGRKARSKKQLSLSVAICDRKRASRISRSKVGVSLVV